MDDEFWKEDSDRDFAIDRTNRIGAINMALLFSTAAIALTLILTPILTSDADDARMEARGFDYDNITTGSISTTDGKTKRYTIRRSVLQDNPGEVCIIAEDGRRQGC